MTVLEQKAAGVVDTTGSEVAGSPGVVKRRLRIYLVVVGAAAIGVGAAMNGLGSTRIDELSPARIAEIRAQQSVEVSVKQYWDQLIEINEQRAQGMVEFYSSQHQARIDAINEQRAQGMVEFYSGRSQARIDAINEQRAQDMVTFKRGWEGEDES